VKRLALLGWPARHSLSPAMQNAAFKSLALPYEYVAIDTPPGSLETVLADLRKGGFSGGNVTIPHKEAIVSLCDAVDERAREVGAVNTLVCHDDRLSGHNTDVDGFRASVAEAGVDLRGAKVVVLGAGGAARAVIAAAAEDGASVVVVARDPARASTLGAAVIPWTTEALAGALAQAHLLVNASAAGMDGAQPPCEVPLDLLSRDAAVFDLVYRPLDTALLSRARSLRLRTIDGLRMLLRQGAAGFRAWTEREPPLAVMEAALADAARSADLGAPAQ